MNIEKFHKDKLAVLDLVYKKFYIESGGKKERQKKCIVYIFYNDLLSCKMDPEEFADVLYLLSQNGALEISDGYDEEIVGLYGLNGEGREPSCFVLSIPPNFYDVYEKLRKEYLIDIDTKKEKYSLKSKELRFDDPKALIFIDNVSCNLPPNQNEHFFCKSMFNHPIGHYISWDEIYGVMTGDVEPEVEGNHWRTVYDTMRAVNIRIQTKLNTEDEMFSCKKKTFRRNY